MKWLITFFVFMISFNSLAEMAGKKNADGTFRVSPKSLSLMGIKFSKVNGNGPWGFPKDALVKIKFTEGVYRRFEDQITFVIVNVVQKDSNQVWITSGDLEAGDEVAVSGTGFLRLTESDLNSDTVDNCAH